ncbi:hypothetical protein [Lysinibacillus pakistanensis]|uniref:Uncharacterized protein n=1 Tax=Lysinibacillus pakistanensis TaxID=759811 RepID=A0ABX6DF49_9BACI|nr:hypothetical protein GDS87_14675 [Lysinibacillus pakistanensis]
MKLHLKDSFLYSTIIAVKNCILLYLENGIGVHLKIVKQLSQEPSTIHKKIVATFRKVTPRV